MPSNIPAFDAGNVERYHTHMGLQQTNAQHTYGMLILLYELHPNPSHELAKAILWHDATEIFTGDSPYLAKRKSKQLWDALHAMEDELNTKWKHDITLTDDEVRWLKGLDIVEPLVFVLGEAMTVKNKIMVLKMVDAIRAWENIPPELLQYSEDTIGRFVEYSGEFH